MGFMAYAHCLINDPRDGTRYEAGDVVPDDLPGLDELADAGSVQDEKYDPDQEETLTPNVVYIEGVRYEKQELPDE